MRASDVPRRTVHLPRVLLRQRHLHLLRL
jgi:hypothetical protein